MRLAPNVFDVWTFQREGRDTRFLLLYSSEEKARRYFGGGRFWQIPSGVVEDGEAVTGAIARKLNGAVCDTAAVRTRQHHHRQTKLAALAGSPPR